VAARIFLPVAEGHYLEGTTCRIGNGGQKKYTNSSIMIFSSNASRGFLIRLFFPGGGFYFEVDEVSQGSHLPRIFNESKWAV